MQVFGSTSTYGVARKEEHTIIERGEAGPQISGYLREEAKADVRVIKLPEERLDEAAGLLARSFHQNPNFVDLFPDEGARSHALPRMFAAGLRDALGFGHVYAATPSLPERRYLEARADRLAEDRQDSIPLVEDDHAARRERRAT